MRSAHLFYPLSGSIDLRKLTVPECASKSEKSFVSTRCFGSSNRKQARTREARTCGEHMHCERLRLPKAYTRCSASSPNVWASACRGEHARAFMFGPSRWTARCAEARAFRRVFECLCTHVRLRRVPGDTTRNRYRGHTRHAEAHHRAPYEAHARFDS